MKINSFDKKLSFFLILSLIFHLIVILILIISKNLSKLFKKDQNILIQNAIRIDTIGLPDLPSKTKSKKEKRKAVTIPKEKKKKEKAVTIPKEKEKKKKGTQKEKAAQKAKNTQSLKNKSNKGNKLSKGAKEGKENISAQQLSEITLYANQIHNQTKAQWRPEKHLTEKQLTSQVEIKINPFGRIIYKQILISSGNELFDNSVLSAIENSSPYPQPPPEIQKFIKDGIVLTLSSE